MPLDQLDVIVRVAGATLLLLAAATSRDRMAASRLWFAPLAACLASFLAGNTPVPGLQLEGPLGRLAVILTGYAAVFLWWFCLAVFDTRFRPRGAVLAVGLTWILVASLDRGLAGPRLADAGLSWVLVGLGLAMVGHLAWRLMRDREGDLLDRRRRVRHAVVVLLGGQLLADLAVDLVLGMDWQPQAFSIVQNTAFLAFTLWLLALGPRRPASPPPAAPVAAPADPVLARLHRLIEIDRIYLDPALTLADFVRAMGAPEKAVRRLINCELGHDHFRSFLSSYRVAEASRLLADPARRDDKLIGIAFDSGFASLPSFNRVFREFQGCTPSAFRAAALAPPADKAAAPGSEVRSAAF